MDDDERERLHWDDLFQALHERGIDVSGDIDPEDLADLVLDHAERFQGATLLYLLGLSLIGRFERRAREECRRQCLLLQPVDVAEDAILRLLAMHLSSKRPRPLRAFAAKIVTEAIDLARFDADVWLFQPDDGTAEKRLLHQACGVVNSMPVEWRRVVYLCWAEGRTLEEIEPITGIHPERSEVMLLHVLTRAQQVLERARYEDPRDGDEESEDTHG